MMYNADLFAKSKNPAKKFRKAFYGASVFLSDGSHIKASKVSDYMVRNYYVESVFDPNFGPMVANRVVVI